MDLGKLSNAELYALYNMAKEMQIKEHNKARVDEDGVKKSKTLTMAFMRIQKLENEINKRLSELD